MSRWIGWVKKIFDIKGWTRGKKYLTLTIVVNYFVCLYYLYFRLKSLKWGNALYAFTWLCIVYRSHKKGPMELLTFQWTRLVYEYVRYARFWVSFVLKYIINREVFLICTFYLGTNGISLEQWFPNFFLKDYFQNFSSFLKPLLQHFYHIP